MSEPERQYVDVADILRHTFNRRTALGGGAGVLAASALAACSNNAGQSYTKQSNGQKKPNANFPIGKANIPTPREQTVVIADVDFTQFDNWNVFVPNGASLGSGFMTMVTEYLFYLNLITGEVTPWLAEKYSYNATNDQLTLNLDPMATWNDGKPFTSADVKFTIMLLRDNAAMLGGGGELKTYVKSVDTPDDHTVVINLTKPNPRFHYRFICVICTGFYVLPEHVWKGQDPLKFKDNPPVRTGPYKLKQAIAAQKMFVWEKTSNYWNKDKLNPKPQYIIFTSTNKQADAAALMFERAEFDNGSIDDPHAEQLANKGYSKMVDAAKFRDPCPRGFWLNCDPARGIIGEATMHQVITKLVDRDKIGSKIMPKAVPPAQWPWADYQGNAKWQDDALAQKYPQKYDPAGAAALLDKIAPKGADGKRTYQGKPISLEIITPVPVTDPVFTIADLLRAELVKQGITATARALTGSVHDQLVANGKFDISATWSCDISVDPIQMFTNLKSEYAVPIGKDALGRNPMRLKDAKLDELVNKLALIRPEDAAAAGVRNQLMEIYYQRLPFVPVVQTILAQYFNTTFWTGWAAGDDLYNIPCHWWGQFTFILAKLQPTGQKAPS